MWFRVVVVVMMIVGFPLPRVAMMAVVQHRLCGGGNKTTDFLWNRDMVESRRERVVVVLLVGMILDAAVVRNEERHRWILEVVVNGGDSCSSNR